MQLQPSRRLMAAPGVNHDPTGLGINLNAQGSPTGVPMPQEANHNSVVRLGGRAISGHLSTPARIVAEDIDGVLARLV